MKILDSGAVFDRSRRYRYRLWRRWDDELPKMVFLMLNPSKADAIKNDQTIRTCMGMAARFGCGSIEVVNLFAFCATYPSDLRAAKNPVGRENDQSILNAVSRADHVLLAWGNHGDIRGRSDEVLALLSDYHLNLVCLGTTKAGHPRHPLYVPATTPLITFSRADESRMACL